MAVKDQWIKERNIEAWRRYGYEQQKSADGRTPTFMRKPETPMRRGIPRSFSLGDLNPRSIRLHGETRGFDGFSVSLACAMCVAFGVVLCRILESFF
jgi:hypothetical protein